MTGLTCIEGAPAMQEQYKRLQLQFEAVCQELDRMHERWGDGTQ